MYACMDTYIQFWVCPVGYIHSYEYIRMYLYVCVCVFFWPLSDSSDFLKGARSRAPSPL